MRRRGPWRSFGPSNMRPWNGWTGSTTATCSSRSATSRRQKPRPTSMPLWKLKSSPHLLPKSASRKPGAVPRSFLAAPEEAAGPLPEQHALAMLEGMVVDDNNFRIISEMVVLLAAVTLSAIRSGSRPSGEASNSTDAKNRVATGSAVIGAVSPAPLPSGSGSRPTPAFVSPGTARPSRKLSGAPQPTHCGREATACPANPR